ncbi:CDP-glycerol glycerophosphotransferase family protein [Microbacteriaceae bacterium VKM Ac-2855]|nr:CDP-glycerol glycerophosphotransferase family protein [Microbacteriaceae bacterium VKM Ac-2855]
MNANDARLALKLARDLFDARRARRDVARALTARGPLPTGRFEIGVYFADAAVNLYQVRQWYRPLLALSEHWPVVILSRNAGAAVAMLAESPVPVAYVRSVADLEQVIDEQPLRIILYVNQNARNFQMMRYGRRWHVFVNHGESDKMYMTTNQFKAYDYSLIAGDAALSRLRRVLWDYDFDRRAIPIGRPQADHYSGVTPFEPDGREVVLYAPTWEGDRAAAAYGSVASHGVALARALLADDRYRLVYRPHPRSGAVDPAYAAANAEIVRMIAAANQTDATAQHVHDTGAELGWQLAVADVAIVDVSAMVYDRLAVGRPILVTRPVEPLAEVDESGYLGDAEWLTAAEASSVVRRIEAVEHDADAAATLRQWVHHYFGDTTPGAATIRFHTAIAGLLAEWHRNAELHAGDDPVDEHDPTA